MRPGMDYGRHVNHSRIEEKSCSPGPGEAWGSCCSPPLLSNLLSACAKRKLIRRRRCNSESQLGEYSVQFGLEHWFKSFVLAKVTQHLLESGCPQASIMRPRSSWI
jgi:hypothetical protein